MSNDKRWHTKRDVIKDLAIANGRSVDFNEEYVIRGERPPPRHMVDEEGEMAILRLFEGTAPAPTQEIVKPDLIGITKMLRMVDQFYERPLLQVSQKDEKTDNITNTIISISKLNPNVADFVPANIDPTKDSNICNNVSLKRKGDIVSDSEINGMCQKEDKFTNTVGQSTNSVNISNVKEISENINMGSTNRVDTSRLTPTEVQEMREKLKNKITVTSNANCVKAKRDRNLAIATLVKLHCESIAAVDPGSDKPKLITPDFYERRLSDHHGKVVEETHNASNEVSAFAETDNLISIPRQDKKVEALVDKNIKSTLNGEETLSETIGTSDRPSEKQRTPSDSPVNKEDMTKEVKDSIAKVENWLNCPKEQAPKRPAIYLGPVTFKRKVNSKPMSPVSTDSENIVQKTETFVPSEFASRLTQKYMEQSKAQEPREDLWTKLESELKAKDEVIKKQRLLMSTSSLDTAAS